ncbi:MAG: sulfatase [Acidobacteria bacterium]|nr:sulfatase [Acidobacteriota bacterium]
MISRRTFLATSAAAFAQPKPLNVILMYADDLGWGDLGCYGSPLSTPHLDRAAAEGMRFTHCISANPVCSPSRAALLTGRYPTRVGVPRVLFPADRSGLAEGEQTLAQILKAKGYKTQCVGKWHLGHTPPNLPAYKGFDHYFGIPYSNDMNPRWLMDDEKVVEEQATLETLTPRYTERAIRFIDANAASPFFLYFPHTYPHIPLAASPAFRGKSPYGIYGDVVSELDNSVGEIMKTLKKHGLEKNTLFLFSSDNGPWYQGSAGRLRGRKGMTWEGGVRVPLIAWQPGRVAKGKVCQSLVSTMDIVPTVCAMTGAAKPAKATDGIDITALLNGSKPALERDVLLYFDGENVQCARWGQWKLHFSRYNNVTYSPAPAGGRKNIYLKNPELYNVVTDPDESFDVAAGNPQVVQKIIARVEEILQTDFPAAISQNYQSQKNGERSPSPAGAVSR